MKIGIDFNDIKSYNENMVKGIEDKLFFLNKLKLSSDESYLFVDFGCADGALISAMYDILSQKGISAYYIGYDISEEMIAFAKSKFSNMCWNVMFTTSWGDVDERVRSYTNMKRVLILSSVIHEVYSYAKEGSDDVGEFWHRVRHTGFDYICVRDMMCSKDINRDPSPEIASAVREKIGFATTLSHQRRDFEEIWGDIYKNNKHLVHFLLKYRWNINWEREVNENYFPIYVEEFLELFSGKYNISYLERFRVPFLDERIKEDFDIELEDNTHIKAIFEVKKVKEG